MDIPMDYTEVTEDYLQEILREFDSWYPEFMALLAGVRAGDRMAIGGALLDYVARTIRETRELKGLPADYDALHQENIEAARNEHQAFAPLQPFVHFFLRRD